MKKKREAAGFEGFEIRTRIKNEKNGKRKAVAVLYDNNTRLPFTETIVTLLPSQSDEDGKKIAQNRAVEKYRKHYEYQHRDRKQRMDAAAIECEETIEQIWNGMNQAQKEDCVAPLNVNEDGKSKARSFFENQILPYLIITRSQATQEKLITIRNQIYEDAYKRTTYSNGEERPDIEVLNQLLTAFFEAFIVVVQSDEQISDAIKESVSDVLDEIRQMICKDERMVYLMMRLLVECGNKYDAVAQAMVNKVNHAVEEAGVPRTLETSQVKRIISLALRELSGNELQTRALINNRIREANEILEGMTKHSEKMPYVRIPLLNIPGIIIQKETTKELSARTRITFAYLMMLMTAESNYAAGALIMLCIGTRVGEVCAMCFGDIQKVECGGVSFIEKTNHNGVIKAGGKNRNAPRMIFLNQAAMDGIEKRKEHLRKIGYTDEQIAQMYIICDSKNPMSPIRPADFSDEVRDWLTKCGCSDEFWAAADEELAQMHSDGCVDENEKSLTAYVLRRDAISIMTNFSQLPPLLVEAIVGHQLPKGSRRWDKEIARRDEWPTILNQLERYVYMPEHSANPGLKKNAVSKVSSTEPTRRVAVKLQKGKRISIKISTCHPGSKIFADLPLAWEAERIERTDLLDGRHQFPMLQANKDDVFYAECKNRAMFLKNQIDRKGRKEDVKNDSKRKGDK